MRIVAVADTHCFQDDLGEIPEGDVFVHAGDMLRRGSLDELVAVASWIRALPHRHKIVVAGNHDVCFQRQRARALELLGPEVHYLEDALVELDGVRFWGAPWQPEFNDWAFNLPRGEALAEKWSLVPSGVDVLVTHGPPLHHGDRTEVHGRQGCEALHEALKRIRPRLHLFGHIHEDGGMFTFEASVLANVTTWESERAPTVFDLGADLVPVQIPPRR